MHRVLFALIIVFSIGLILPNQTHASNGGSIFVAGANQKRATVGLGPVRESALLNDISHERSKQMAAANKMEHNMAYVQKRLNDSGICYQTYGEIIYYSSGFSVPSYERSIEAWWKSPAHYAIMTGNYNGAGGSWAQSSNNVFYATMIFVRFCGSSIPGKSAPRLAGADRYATAGKISNEGFIAPNSNAFIATGANFPDALAGVPAAAQRNASLLLVNSSFIPTSVSNELKRLKPRQIFILGGTGVVSSSVENSLKAYATNGVVRIAGSDRYDTAAAISRNIFAPGVQYAFIATGSNFPDALAGGAAAAYTDSPVLLTAGSLPVATRNELTRLQPKNIIILGGTGVVSNTVATELKKYTSGSVTRIGGVNRYATASAVSKYFFDNAKGYAPAIRGVYVATGSNFPDGLAGGALGSRFDAPLLLNPGGEVHAETAKELQRLAPRFINILGGTGVISNNTAAGLGNYLR